MISASAVALTIGALAFAIAMFMRSNALDTTVSQFVPGLIAMGADIFAGSLLTALLVARRAGVASRHALAVTASSPYEVLALALARTEGCASRFAFAATINRERQPFL